MAIAQQKESIHADHKVIFSHGSLNQLLHANGLTIKENYFTFLPRTKESPFKKLTRLICKFRPCVSETMLAVCKVQTNPEST